MAASTMAQPVAVTSSTRYLLLRKPLAPDILVLLADASEQP